MKDKEAIAEQLNDFKQELSFTLRSTHALIEETESLDSELIMGMLHVERSLINKLCQIIETINKQ